MAYYRMTIILQKYFRGKAFSNCINSVMEYVNGNIVAKYVLNLCNNEEKNFIQGWLKENAYNQMFVSQIARNLNNQI